MEKEQGWILMVVLCLAVALAGTTAVAQMKPPADYTFNDGDQGKVLYSHQAHMAKNLKCTDCHTKIFKMAKPAGPLKMADLNAGKECGTCHDGKKAFATSSKDNCVKCHKK
ncbi:MAG TPA: cytochrome c3 family protein [Candidatus Baltobacteraceae bacterium]|nr:cytochrome c3 family protein [Candidatus Baltobacteraceae bacterium]